jgi:hypothetical protein
MDVFHCRRILHGVRHALRKAPPSPAPQSLTVVAT